MYVYQMGKHFTHENILLTKRSLFLYHYGHHKDACYVGKLGLLVITISRFVFMFGGIFHEWKSQWISFYVRFGILDRKKMRLTRPDFYTISTVVHSGSA